MPRHNKYDLLEQIVKAVTDSGWNVLYVGNIDEHPFQLQIYRENESYRVRVYIWHMAVERLARRMNIESKSLEQIISM